MSKLAINGGKPVRKTPFPSQNTLGESEKRAVLQVMDNGRLSGYRANAGSHFLGGPEIQALEKEWSIRFNVKHVIACNSATSGLFIACGAADIKDREVIVSPFSMTCSATMPLAWGGIPVFVDVENDCFCVDANEIEKAITPKTKAIIAVSIFGQIYNPAINDIAKKHNLIVIEDAAQALSATYFSRSGTKRFAGTIGDVGIFSLNFGKHISAGEGGLIVTNDDRLAAKCRLLMNHGESVQNDQAKQDVLWPELFGFNLRMTELTAAVTRAQLKKIDNLLKQRLDNVSCLNDILNEIPAISISKVRDNCTHTYYVLPYLWNKNLADGLHRNKYIEAVKAELMPRLGREGEGVPIGCGYIKPINQMRVFKARNYNCHLPVVEKLYNETLFLTLFQAPNSTVFDIFEVSDAFKKVWKYRDELR